MKKTMYAIFTGLAVLWPTVALANGLPRGPGCWFLGADLNNFLGVALVSFSVGIVFFSRRP